MPATEKEKTALQKRWQHLQIRLRKGTPSEKCDTLRSLMSQVEFARALDILDVDSSFELMGQYIETYTSIVDSPVENGGVDNYAVGALAISSSRKNESKEWKSSLNKENILKLDCVKNFIKETKLARKMYYPDEDGNTVYKLPNKSTATVNLSKSSKLNHSAVTTEKKACNLATSNPISDSTPNHFVPNKSSSSTGNQGPNNYTFKSASISNTSNIKQNAFDSNKKEGAHQHDQGKKQLFKNTHTSNIGDSGSWGQQAQSNTKKDFWNLGNSTNKRPCESGPLDGESNWDVENSRSRNINYPNNTGQQNPYARFAPSKAFPPYRKPQKRHCPDDEDMEEEIVNPNCGAFKTASEQLAINAQKKYGSGSRGGTGAYGSHYNNQAPSNAYGNQKKSLGTRRGLNSKFVPPVIRDDNEDGGTLIRKAGPNKGSAPEEPVDERLKNIDPKMIELVSNEIMDHGLNVTWDDIAGLEFAKKTITEIVVWPMLRPDIFTGLRGPPKGLLLFGPPGTGKTLIGKCIASQSKSTFFSISASSLTSKWVGEGEKMVRALFAVARVHQPAVIFIDEIDSLLSQRTDGEHEASRRIKTEFLVQLDGATTGSEDRILVVGATNRPQEIDEAARRRFVKRLYIPLPESLARRQIVVNLMNTQPNELNDEEIEKICSETIGYSGADMANLCREAALGPIRSISLADIENITPDQVRPIVFKDFKEAIMHVRPSVSEKDLDVYLDWNRQYGSWGK